MFRMALFNPSNIDISAHKIWMNQEFEITTTTSVEATLPILKTWQPQVLLYCTKVVDAEILKVLRNAMKVDVGLMILSTQYRLKDELISFEQGADYYLLLSSPSHAVKSRLIRLAEKSQTIQGSIQKPNILGLPKKHDVFRFHNLTIYSNQNYVLLDDRHIRLTPTEMALLLMFVTNPNSTIKRESIKSKIFYGQEISLRTIDAHIAKLKGKITTLKDTLHSVYGSGYVLKSSKNSNQVA